MIFNQTDHILANGSFTIPDGSDSITIRVPGFKRSAPSLVLTPIGPNADVKLFVDDSTPWYQTQYAPISYSLIEAFETKNGSDKYSATGEAMGADDTPTLAAWWRLNEKPGSNGTTRDSSANAIDADQPTAAYVPTLSTTLYPSTYIQKSSYTFDGSNDKLELGATSIWDGIIGSTGTSKMTFAAWIYPTDTGAGSIFVMGGSHAVAGVVVMWVQSGIMHFYTRWNGGAYYEWLTVALIEQEKWTHVAFTYDATSPGNAPAQYVNGVAVANDSTNGTTPTGDWDGILGESYIGSWGSGGSPFTGQLADAAIWNKVLSKEEIKAIYDASIAGVVDDGMNGWLFTIRRSSDAGVLTAQWQTIAADPVRTEVRN